MLPCIYIYIYVTPRVSSSCPLTTDDDDHPEETWLGPFISQPSLTEPFEIVIRRDVLYIRKIEYKARQWRCPEERDDDEHVRKGGKEQWNQEQWNQDRAGAENSDKHENQSLYKHLVDCIMHTPKPQTHPSCENDTLRCLLKVAMHMVAWTKYIIGEFIRSEDA